MCCDEKTSESSENESKENNNPMLKNMMDCCCSDMTDEEKQKWSKNMHKMMHYLKECGLPFMGMMGAKMGRMHGIAGKEHMPWEVCKEMIADIRQSHRIATMATPEVQGLFEDWVEQIEQEMLEYLKDKDEANINDLSSHFKISKDSAYYFVTKLARKGKIKLKIKTDKS